MIRHVLFGILLVCLAGGLAFRYEFRRDILENGTELLLPVYIHKTDKTDKAVRIFFRYHSIIPASEIGKGGSVAVVSRNAGGRASFVRMFDPEIPLKPREHLLKFRLSHRPGLERSTEASKIKFASDVYVLRSKEKTEELAERLKTLRIKYAVLKVNEKGDAVLKGVADQNGIVLSTQY